MAENIQKTTTIENLLIQRAILIRQQIQDSNDPNLLEISRLSDKQICRLADLVSGSESDPE